MSKLLGISRGIYYYRLIVKKSDSNLENEVIKIFNKNHKTTVYEDKIENEVNRKFDGRALSEVVVSDLTYVRVGSFMELYMHDN